MLKFNDIIFIILFGGIILSYVDEVIETIIEQNPSEPEFHQAIREVLESLRVVIEENEEEYVADLGFAARSVGISLGPGLVAWRRRAESKRRTSRPRRKARDIAEV